MPRGFQNQRLQLPALFFTVQEGHRDPCAGADSSVLGPPISPMLPDTNLIAIFKAKCLHGVFSEQSTCFIQKTTLPFCIHISSF